MRSREEQELTAEKIFSILGEHSELLKRLSVKKIGVFGSFAQGEQELRSDIDFLVEFARPTFDNFMDLLFSLEKYLGRRVDLITEGSLSPHIRAYAEKEVRWYEV
ncbi:MAG: nucleotidyltransferase family protein [Armatimonadetes bacterium]|nr:nucleotidyltransferase family protein [Armatimonadota bacterium]